MLSENNLRVLKGSSVRDKKALIFSGDIFRPLLSNRRFARHRLSLISSSRILTPSATHTTNASFAKPMMLVPAGSSGDVYHSLDGVHIGPFPGFCIKRSWTSFPLSWLRCRNSTSHLSTSEAFPGTPGRNHYRRHGQHLPRPCLNMSGTSGAPWNLRTRAPRSDTFNRHLSCRGCCSCETYCRTPVTRNSGNLLHLLGCGTLPIRSSIFLAVADMLCLPQLIGSLWSSFHRDEWRACRTRQRTDCPVPSAGQ